MDWSRLAEDKINEAISSGELTPVVRPGVALNFDAYFAIPEDDRLAYSVLKSSGHIPSEADWLREIAELKERLAQTTNEELRQHLASRLMQVETEWAMRLDRVKVAKCGPRQP